MSSRSARPTIYDVARLAGVSTATVSRALNRSGQTSARTQALIEAAVAQLGYRPNTLARSLVTKSTQTIAFLLPDVTNPFYAELVAGIQQSAARADHTMLLCTTHGDAEQEERYLELLRSKQVDGALVDGLVLPPERIARFVEDGFPIVCLDRDVDSPAVPLVQVDNRLGARLATQHLQSLGHDRIAHVAGPGTRIAEDRLIGYRQALRGEGFVAHGDFTEDGGYDATTTLLRHAPSFTALFAANDLSAIGAMTALAERGLRIPGDVSVVGFDDIRLASYTTPPLTTVQQPAATIAEQATSILLDLVAGRPPRRLRWVYRPRLLVRASTAPPAG